MLTRFSGKMASSASGVTGFLVPGWSGGGIGSGKSGSRLYHWVGISAWGKVNRMVRFMVILRQRCAARTGRVRSQPRRFQHDARAGALTSVKRISGFRMLNC